jgi:hypothetical protein
MRLSKSKTKTEAIIMALEEYIRRRTLEGSINMRGETLLFRRLEESTA